MAKLFTLYWPLTAFQQYLFERQNTHIPRKPIPSMDGTLTQSNNTFVCHQAGLHAFSNKLQQIHL